MTAMPMSSAKAAATARISSVLLLELDSAEDVEEAALRVAVVVGWAAAGAVLVAGVCAVVPPVVAFGVAAGAVV